jgi:hypothetical protein
MGMVDRQPALTVATELGLHEVTEESLIGMDAELSALELLSSALQDAVDAHRTGLIAGPGVDEVALRRAQRRALRADVSRLLSTPGRDGAA